MKIKKTIASFVLAGALAFGSSGCSKDYPQYEFEGKIGGDLVKLERYDDLTSKLSVTKPDGRVITYVDSVHHDSELDAVFITKDGEKRGYSADTTIGKPVVEEAQKQFDNYLKRILEIRKETEEQVIKTEIKQGLDNLM